VVLCNTAAYMNNNTDNVGFAILKCLLGLPYEPLKPEQEVTVDPAVLDAYTGSYVQVEGKRVPTASGKLEVSRQDNRLTITDTPEEQTKIYPASETHFFSKGDPIKVRFAREQNGNVTRMFVKLGEEETSWLKK